MRDPRVHLQVHLPRPPHGFIEECTRARSPPILPLVRKELSVWLVFTMYVQFAVVDLDT